MSRFLTGPSDTAANAETRRPIPAPDFRLRRGVEDASINFMPLLRSFLLVLAATSLVTRSPSTAQTVEPKLFKLVGSCKPSGNSSPGPILIVKQWHLPPGLHTKGLKAPPEQARNLGEIEEQLGKWIEAKRLKTLVAEGCEGKFDDTIKFNDWSLAELKRKSTSKEFKAIVTHPALKLEARYGDRVATVCGDLSEGMRDELLAFSDARATVGFLTRIVEHEKDAAKQKIYLDGAIEAYHFPTTAKPAEIVQLLRQELKKTVARIKELNLKRSQSLAQTAIIIRDEPIAILVGGTHAREIAQKLEEKHRDCVIYEPLHYSQNEEDLLQQLDRLL